MKGAWTMWVWMLAGTFWGLFAMSVAWLVRRRRSRP
ncbi:MAG TPA: MYXO-CTERM sorting domain-containing protein [Actinomycetota bacterium]|nr:MYXO-CTERM sorting domain-containing protein [Actinomycetota bacterium]